MCDDTPIFLCDHCGCPSCGTEESGQRENFHIDGWYGVYATCRLCQDVVRSQLQLITPLPFPCLAQKIASEDQTVRFSDWDGIQKWAQEQNLSQWVFSVQRPDCWGRGLCVVTVGTYDQLRLYVFDPLQAPEGPMHTLRWKPTREFIQHHRARLQDEARCLALKRDMIDSITHKYA